MLDPFGAGPGIDAWCDGEQKTLPLPPHTLILTWEHDILLNTLSSSSVVEKFPL